MIHALGVKQRLYLAITALICAALVSCARSEKPELIDFELTGRVLDKETNQPVEGAYAIAIYKGVVASSAGVASHCVKTKGMYTGKDGKFRFPVEKRDGYSPWNVEAITVDHSHWTTDIKPDRIHHLQRAEAYTDRNVYMVKQDPLNPSYFGGGDVYCVHAKNKEDAAASVEYYKVKKMQYLKYHRGQSALDSIDESIQRLETLDGRMPDQIRAEPRPPKKLN